MTQTYLGGEQSPPTSDQVVARLAAAHFTLVRAAPFPALMRALQPYAGILHPFLAAWNFRIPNIGPTKPGGEELAAMLQTFAWLAHVPPDPPRLRTAVVLRSMASIKTNAPRSWTSIGSAIRADHHTAQRVHAQAVEYIVKALRDKT